MLQAPRRSSMNNMADAEKSAADDAIGIRLTRSTSSPPQLMLRFDPQVSVRFVPRIDNMSYHEQRELWFSDEEYSSIRRREKKLMNEVSRRVLFHATSMPKKHSRPSLAQRVLGLQTSQEHVARCQHIRETQLLVLDEQNRHSDPEKLAQKYSQVSLSCSQAARDQALTVEIVLRNLELYSDDSTRVHFPEDEMTSQSSRTTMKHRRWAADSTTPSSSPPSSMSLSEEEEMSLTRSQMMTLRRPTFTADVINQDIPLSVAMNHQLHQRRRHDMDISWEMAAATASTATGVGV